MRASELKEALRHPTLKTRMAQAFIIVLIIVFSLVLLGASLLVLGEKAREKAYKAGMILSVSGGLDGSLSLFNTAFESLSEGEIKAAESNFGDGLAGCENILNRLRAANYTEITSLVRSFERFLLDLRSAWDGAKSKAQGKISDSGKAALARKAEDMLTRGSDLRNRFSKIAYRMLSESKEMSKANRIRAVVGFWACVGATFILGFITMTLAYRSITGGVRKIIKEIRGITSGESDLTAFVTIPSKDVFGELADSINGLLLKMRERTREMRHASTELARAADSLSDAVNMTVSAVDEISSSIVHITAGTQEQAVRAEKISSGMGKIKGTIGRIYERAKASSAKSEEAAERARTGGEKSSETASIMESIHESVVSASKLMEELNERISKIGGATLLITEISEQTNLLALNAAIEAARAGEHGSGFAVVAAEVRKLAESSRHFSSDITKSVNEMIRETERLTSELSKGAKLVKSGVRVARDAGESMNVVVEACRQAELASREISDSLQAISLNVDEAFESINEIAAIAQETAGSVEEVNASVLDQKGTAEGVAEAAEKLRGLAVSLEETISGFRI